jgi:hypothetical protein
MRLRVARKGKMAPTTRRGRRLSPHARGGCPPARLASFLSCCPAASPRQLNEICRACSIFLFFFYISTNGLPQARRGTQLLGRNERQVLAWLKSRLRHRLAWPMVGALIVTATIAGSNEPWRGGVHEVAHDPPWVMLRLVIMAFLPPEILSPHCAIWSFSIDLAREPRNNICRRLFNGDRLELAAARCGEGRKVSAKRPNNPRNESVYVRLEIPRAGAWLGSHWAKTR